MSYQDTRNEAEVVAMLADALAAGGYIVRREVHCTLPYDLGHGEPVQRRIDLWAMRRPVGKPSPPLGPAEGGCMVVQPGGVMAVEVKWTIGGGSKLWRCGIQQAKAAMRAHDWFTHRDGRKVALQRPSVVLVCDQWALAGVREHEALDPLRWDGGDLWANGAGVLRGWRGGMSFRAHVGRQDYTVQVLP